MLLCIQSQFEQRKSSVESDLVLLADGAGSLVFDLLVEGVAVADGRNVVALEGSVAGVVTGVGKLRALRTVPPGVACGKTETCALLAIEKTKN